MIISSQNKNSLTRIKSPMSSTNQPNTGLSFSPFSFFERLMPSSMPANAITDTLNKSILLKATLLIRSPTNPIRQLMVMMVSEVAMALFTSSLAYKSNAGTIRKPPPAPSKPVTNPTPIAITISFKVDVLPVV